MGSLSIILSAIALALSLIAVFYAYKRHIEERKPVLILDEKIEEDEDTGKKTIKTMIINVGKGPALNIRPADWLPADCVLWVLPKITRNLACTGSIQRETVFSRGIRLIKPETHWEIQYEDIDGRSYRTVLKGTHHYFDRIGEGDRHLERK